jgi:REP element-mobilizing transposase RayT
MGHTFSNILIHAVFSTKNREPLIREAFRERLYQYMCGIAQNEFGRVLRIGGMADHIHGLLFVNPSISVSDAIGKWKSLSSGWVNRELPEFAPFYWQAGYGAFSVSESRKADVIEYIDNQEAHHRGRSFQEEYLELLKRHGIEFDADQVWD